MSSILIWLYLDEGLREEEWRKEKAEGNDVVNGSGIILH